MKKDIYVTGIGQTPFGEHWDKSIKTLLDEAIDAAIENSPCTALDIDFVIVANMLGERINDQAHLGSLASSLLPHRPPALRTEAACASGAIALHTACSLLESDRATSVLVVGVEKMTDVDTAELSAALMGAADSESDIPSGLTFPGIFGLIAQRYMHEYGLTREDLNYVSSVHHQNAEKNPFAQFRTPITPKQVGQSTMVADPLRLLDCSPITDGAAACILSTHHKSDIKIAASQMSSDHLSITDRAVLTSFPTTKEAAVRALEEADITIDDIDIVELHDCFSIAAVINVEDLGLAEPGEGISLYKEKNSSVILNGSGGLKACGHPVAATGIKQIIDISKQLQTTNSSFGLAQNFGGIGATCGIHILEHNAQ